MSAVAQSAAPACRVCGSHRTSLHLSHPGSSLIRCGECTVVFSVDEPDAEQIKEHYSAAYFSGGEVEYADYLGDEVAHRAQARRYLAKLQALGLRPSTLFDVGCAAGFFLDEARKSGWTVAGCDVSAAALDHARRNLGLDVTEGDFLDATAHRGTYDVVTAFNVFEHLPNPAGVVERLGEMVRPGGHLLIETWNHESLIARALGRRWHQWRPPFVPYYYTRKALGTLFSPSAWELLEYRRSTKQILFARGLGVLRAGRLPRGLDDVLRALEAGPLGRLRLTYGLGDLVLAVLRRRAV